MSNISKQKRNRMLTFLDELKKFHKDDEKLIAINEIENALNEKKYGLIWEEHSERVDKELKNKIPVFREVKDKEIIMDKNEHYNFLIEGDNLHSLYLLEKTHKNKIDVIYLDPPYNTGKKDFIYNDDNIDSEDGFKHSKWLSFMNKRLLIAKALLSDDGIISISIDENEMSQLKLLCDEIFGEENRLTTQHIQVRYSNKSLNEDNDWQPVMEYVLIYSKNRNNFVANKPYEPYDLTKFKFEIKELSQGKTVEIEGKKVTIFKDGEWEIKEVEGHIDGLKETWASGSLVRQGGTAAEFLSKYLIQRKEIDGLNVLYKIDGMGQAGDGIGYRYVSGPKRPNAIRGKFYTGVPIFRREELEKGISNKTKPIPNYMDYSADFGNIRHEGGVAFNNGKKPIKMIKEIINFHTKKDIIVMDFFAGSGSTAHAVLEMNKEDKGNRKFVLCTNNENNICEEITYKRMENIKEDYTYNLKYYKTDYVDRFHEEIYISDELIEHIEEMIQLENHIKIDNDKYVVFFDDQDVNAFMSNNKAKVCEIIFKPPYVFLTTEQLKIINKNDIKVVAIPEYYFATELKEVGEI